MAVSPAGRRPAGRRLWRSPRCAKLASAVPVPFAARPAASGWLCLPRGRTPSMAFTALCGFGKRCPRPVCRASRCGGVVAPPRGAGRRLWRSPRCAKLASAVPVPFAARPAAAGWSRPPRGRTPPMAFTALCGFGKRCPRPVCRASRCGRAVVSSAGQAPVCRYASMLPAGSAAMSPAGQAAVRSCVSRRFARVRAAPAAPSQPAPFPDRPTGGKTHPS